MLSTFPAPVLSVTADAVKDLQGQDALSALWALFTKCKESLQEGRRLENISWRLWHRELLLAQQAYQPPTPDSVSHIKPTPNPLPSFFPFTDPVRSAHPSGTSSCTHSTSISHNAPAPPSTPSPVVPDHPPIPKFSSGTPVALPLSTSFRHKSSPFVGQIIIDMLPNNVLIPEKPRSPHAMTQSTVPSVRLPSSPASIEAPFPRVIVVNPTPQPTPPMTPHLNNNPPGTPQPPSTFLLPPLLPPALTTKRQLQAPQSPAPEESSPLPAPVRGAESSRAPGRFFLQHSPDDVSPERDGSTESGKSHIFDASSVASSQMQSVTTDNEREVKVPLKVKDYPCTKPKKGKEVGKPSARPLAKRTNSSRRIVPSIQRKSSNQDNKPRAVFNIGSNSSTGSKSGNGSSAKLNPLPPMVNGFGAMLNGMTAINTRPARPPVTPPAVANGNPVASENIGVGNNNAAVNTSNGTVPQQRKTIVIASTSEEDYETTDAEDSGWASEDMDAEDKAREAEKVKLSEAAVEAQRQLDLFAKVPKRSYSNLNRTPSGLLSQLLNPNPAIFQPNRLSHSTADIVRIQRQAQREAQQVQAPQRSSSGFAGPVRLHTSKSSVALPLAAQITAMSSSKPSSSGMRGKECEKGGYRPKGRPKEEEMEDESGDDDEDNDKEDDDDDDKIQVSRSVAQQKLQALISRRAPEPGVASHLVHHTRPVEHRVAPPAQTTAPIPLGHPYNLPAPTPPMTPRTTRRRMLKQELSESMRRQLLWERQVSSTTNPAATARRVTNSSLGGVRPVASITSELNTGATATKSADTEDKDERKRRAMARNRSWADDYHYSGW